jgi:uncharacterized membrane protein YeaQ/YmgE (transglycosylase-associated protein family)
MSLIIFLITGAVVGWIASMITKTDAQMGWISNIIVGIVGSALGGAIYTLLFKGSLDFTTAFLNFSLGGLIVSILGAVALIYILKAIKK